MARPPKPPNPVEKQVEALAAINCTWEEISAVTGIPLRTAKSKFGTNYHKGKEQGKMNLRKTMWEKAMGGNIVMMIWLSKQMLGYSDKVEQSINADVKQSVVHDTTGGDGKPLDA